MRRGSSSILQIALLVLMCAAAVRTARAQCEPGWWPGGGISGLDGAPTAIVEWDPDGDGPQPSLLAVAGYFSHAGSVEASGVATWDGERWNSLDAEMTVAGPHEYVHVNALAVYNGELYVGGQFDAVGDVPAAAIARWDGTSWQPVGTGLSNDEGTSGTVNVLLCYGGELIAAGDFHFAGDVAVKRIARWDGQTWRPLGPGVNGGIAGLTIHEGELVAVGDFTLAGGLAANDAASWNGEVWRPLGAAEPPADPNVFDIRRHGASKTAVLSDGDDLIAGIAGWEFTGMWYYYKMYTARWSGTEWQRIEGLYEQSSSYKSPGPSARVNALCAYGGEIYVGGSNFRLRRWTGSEWHEVGPAGVSALCAHDGDLIVGGGFSKVGDLAAARIARWDGTTWHAFGYALDAAVNALVSFKGALIAGGEFVRAGNVDVNHVARWDGANWQPLGAGLDGPVYALTVYGGELIAGGEFAAAGDVEARSIARWDGNGWTALGAGVDGLVRAFAEYGGALIVGGEFRSAGDVTAENVAQWDGSAWGALQGTPHGIRINALAIYNGELIVGGDFATSAAPDLSGGHLARWDGASWQMFEQTINNGRWWSESGSIEPSVYALTVYNNELIVGGNFKYAGDTQVMGVARWDGTGWSKLGNGFSRGDYLQVRAFAVYHDELIAGGQFQDLDYLAHWDGTQWRALGFGGRYPNEVRALTIHHCDLIVGGDFSRTGANASAYWARWGSPCDANCPEANGADDPNSEQDAPPAPVCPLAAGTLVTLTVVGLVRSRRATASHRPR